MLFHRENGVAGFYSAKIRPNVFPLLFFICIFTFGYIIPAISNPVPSGSDVYFHMTHTQRMAGTPSLLDFYETSLQEESLGYDYPFGMWIFGSAVMKVTGSDIFEVAVTLPILMALVSLLIYFIYADLLIQSRKFALFAVIFLISMPYLALNMLNYSTNRFVTAFLITIILLSIQRVTTRNCLFIAALAFALTFTHTGTYMFLLIFVCVYFIAYAMLWKRYAWSSFFTILILLLLYVFTMDLFPIIQNQYIDKGRMLISTGDSLSVVTHLPFFSDMGNLLYTNFFVQNSLTYAILWAGFLFAIAAVSIHLRKKIDVSIANFHLTIPFIGNITNISHSIATTPFWIGPIQTLLSIPGFFKLDRKGICIFMALIASSLIPGAMQSGDGTGVLREIYYLFLIIPITAALGLAFVIIWLKRWEKKKRHRWLARGIYLLLLVPLIVIPIIGTIHFLPGISGTSVERVSLEWLASTGSPFEGVTDTPYRDRIDMYAHKSTPDTHPGSETKQYSSDLYKTLFYSGAENNTLNLQIFNIWYIISSDRLLRDLGKSSASLQIDGNTELNKIYSSNNDFRIYKIIPAEIAVSGINATGPSNYSEVRSPVRFAEKSPVIQDLGSFYLCENQYYKIKLGKGSPRVYYLGTKEVNLLGEGYTSTVISLVETGKANPDFVETSLDDLTCERVTISGDQIAYTTSLRDATAGSTWATCIVTYQFYEKALKRTVLLTHDLKRESESQALNILYADTFFVPIRQFALSEISEGESSQISRRIYPSQDLISLKDKKISDIYMNIAPSGLAVSFGDSSPYPEQITYKGSTMYEYGFLNYYTRSSILPAEPVVFEEYWAIGNQDGAKEDIQQYRSVSFSDYPGGSIPVVMTGYVSPETNFSDIQHVTDAFTRLHVPYSLAAQNATIDGKETELAYIGGSYRVNRSDRYMLMSQEISRLNPSLVTQGVLFNDYSYSSSAITQLAKKSLSCAVGIPVYPPVYGLNVIGTRLLKPACLNGQETDVILIPASLPASRLIASGTDPQSIFSQWLSVVQVLDSTRGIGVFRLDPMDITSLNATEAMVGFLGDVQNRGATFTSLTDVARHYKAMKSLIAYVHRGSDEVQIAVENSGKDAVKDATVIVAMPVITDQNSYTTDYGRITRTVPKGNVINLFVSFDIQAGERITIHITPAETRRPLTVNLEGLAQGRNRIIVRDTYGNVIPGAIVMMDTTSFTTDAEGAVSIWMRRGVHTFSIQKPGYIPLEFTKEIKGKIYRLIPFMRGN